ncbi:MAG: transposase [Pseudomonadota bacterium]
MCKSRSEAPLVETHEKIEGGQPVKEACREAGISEASYAKSKSKNAGTKSADSHRLQELEDESQRLKRMFYDLSQKLEQLQDLVDKKL